MADNNHGERLATIEADIQHMQETISQLQADLRGDKNSMKNWIRSIAVGIVALFFASGLNFMVWLLNKVGL